MFIMLLFLSTIFLNFSNHSFAMQGASNQLNKCVNPIGYITDTESIDNCKEVLKLNPEHPQHIPYQVTDKWTGKNQDNRGHLGKVIRRHAQLLIELQGAIFGIDTRVMRLPGTGIYRTPNPATVELIRLAAENEDLRPYFSMHALVVLYANLEKKREQSKADASIIDANLNKIRAALAPTRPQINSLSEISSKKEEKKVIEKNEEKYVDPVTYESFKTTVLHDNSGIIEAGNNWLRKHYMDCLGHLTAEKTQLFSSQLLRYSQFHPGHNEFFSLNSENHVHKTHVYRTFEREMLLATLVNNAILKDDQKTILALNPFKPDNPKSLISEHYFPPILKAMIAGYLEKKSKDANNKVSSENNLLKTSVEKCKCNPPKLLISCEICLAQSKDQSATAILNSNCSCKPPKLLKDCVECLAKSKIVHPELKDKPKISLEQNCECKKPKKLKDCNACLSKLVQQQQL